MNMQKVYDHKGNFKDVEVGLLDFTLYKLRPRLDNELPKDRIAKVQETKEAIEKYIHQQARIAFKEGQISAFEHMKNLANMCIKSDEAALAQLKDIEK